jgi:hypothetical protein
VSLWREGYVAISIYINRYCEMPFTTSYSNEINETKKTNQKH